MAEGSQARGATSVADSASATGWRWNDHLLLPAQRRLLHGGDEVELEDRVVDLLVLLLESRERALGRQEIISAIWGKRPVNDATLRQLVYKARRAVGDDGVHQTVIHTAYGRSLQWIAPVERVFEPDPHATASVIDAQADPLPRSAPDDAAALVFEPPVSVADTPLDKAHVARLGRLTPRRIHFVAGGVILLLVIGAIAVVAGMGWESQRPPVPPRSVAMQTAPAPAASGPVTIAVLPFQAIDPQQDTRYLTDGITEELINRLGRFPGLRVAARTSSFVFRDKPVDVREAARKLGVANVLEGSVQRSGDRTRVRVALISAKDGYELWSDVYEPAGGDVLQAEDEIATAVIRELQPNRDAYTLAVLRAMQKPATANPSAHDFYLVGLQYLNRRTASDIQQATLNFRRAIMADPGYAEAWSRLAAAYAMLRDYDSDHPPDTHYAEALAAATKTIALDPDLAHVHAVLGLLHEQHWQWALAAQEFRHALRLDPSDAVAHQWYAMHQWYLRDPRTALAEMQAARELDPLSPIINTDLGRALLFNGRVDAAIEQFRATLKLDPDFALCHLLLAQAEMAKGRYPEALKASRTAIALTPAPHPSSYLAVLGVALSLSGDGDGANQQLQVLESRSRQHYVSGVSLALLQAQLGQRDQMFASLARAVADHDPLMRPAIGARSAPWDGDPRFAALLVQMGLATKH